jgi:hypothetical protein
MTYFGEIFDRKNCGSMKQAVCDNCASKVCMINSCGLLEFLWRIFVNVLLGAEVTYKLFRFLSAEHASK